jgi:hypothetical protein
MGAMSRPYAESPTELPAMRFPTDLIARTKALVRQICEKQNL